MGEDLKLELSKYIDCPSRPTQYLDGHLSESADSK